MKKYFTREELLETIIDHLQDYGGYYEELHHEVFNTSVYIEGKQKAEQALEEYGIYKAVGKVYMHEKNTFGDVYTNLLNPVKTANMLWYVLGFEIMLELDLFEYYGLADEETNKELITKLEAQLTSRKGKKHGQNFV